MAKNLVIVESPAKAKTIENYLGKDFVVKSSFGHVRDLAKKGEAIDIEFPTSVDLEVTESDMAIRGDTATGVTKKVRVTGSANVSFK